ncbi:MAG: hypothetical protein HC936_08645 [Leptolyngbyaceae cyanobacterium SU_3_3]|nr:hypothetical protein [Leptolyngbyaceae cyanobacterium SU_3_3]
MRLGRLRSWESIAKLGTNKTPAQILYPYPSREPKKTRLIAPFSPEGKSCGEGFASLREQGCPNSRRGSNQLSIFTLKAYPDPHVSLPKEGKFSPFISPFRVSAISS